MSFKREGDDRSQLNLLKKRRVAELLANDIPDDEALLMRNGRYACTVCSHRPVFDTVDMLAIHRQGKKHKKCLENHYAQKRNFALEIQKRKQEIALRTQDTSKVTTVQDEAPLLQKTRMTVKNALLKAAPYDSRSKAHQSNTGDQTARNNSNEKKGLFFQTTRKQHLQLSQTSSQSSLPAVTEVTPASSLPGNTNLSSSSSHPSQTDNNLLNSEERTSHKFKKRSLFTNDEEQKPKFQLQPYVPKSKRKPHSSPTQHLSKLTPRGPVLPTKPLQKDYKPSNEFWEPLHRDGIPQYSTNASVSPKEVSSGQEVSTSQSALHHSHSKQNTHIRTNVQQANISTKEQNSKVKTVNPDSSVRSNVMKELLQRDAKKNTALEQVQQALIGKKTERPQTDRADATPATAHSCSPTDATKMSDKRRQELQYHLHLTSSGWKRDHGGNWIKDEEVEFDSDEETPPDF